MNAVSHQAVGPALGYYYQAIYALLTLFDSHNLGAYISIETFDDVFLSDGSKKELHQLKHSVSEDTTISIKSDELWRTIKVWCDYLSINNASDGIFTLSTVAALDSESELKVLLSDNSPRDKLEAELIAEAMRVMDKRKGVAIENSNKLSRGEKEATLPFAKKYKGCQAFLALNPQQRTALLKNIRMKTESFTVAQATDEVLKRIRPTTDSKIQQSLAERILEWWDRQAVQSLTGERHQCIYQSELQEFITRKGAELYDDGFTNDLPDMEIPPIISPNPIQKKQLELIGASKTQVNRSYQTEIRARIQREKWIDDNLPAAKKLEKYDQLLIQEWSYKFDEIVDKKNNCTEDQIKEEGRLLLDWTHHEAHQQVGKISKSYDNPDLIRGSYQMLSSCKKVGWHCDFQMLLNADTDE
ncbi:ABC-three component system protein [Pedobacter sp. SYSU D00535]|uniref:ABC-three component system protein n=1 Tax=Pedobacter sp. SYSU D00535 TaxID=2810308 RepID=UPI001A972C1D|nr:ABC-three component system protein [Pedobacter sp. SYSU D00535]